MKKWGLADSAACECGEPEQTAYHIIKSCPLHRPPSEAGLVQVGPLTRARLQQTIWYDDTRKKKKMHSLYDRHDQAVGPYSLRGMTRPEHILNYRLSRARRVVENAFGILANRFQVHLSTMQQQPETAKLIVTAWRASCAGISFAR